MNAASVAMDGRERSHRGVRTRGDCSLVLLKLISEKPSHGYELIKAVEDSVGGAYSPSPGVVYPTLALLEDLGYTQVSEAEGGKKLFTITPEGQAFLAEQAEALAHITGRMEQVAVDNRGRNAPQVVRAMEKSLTHRPHASVACPADRWTRPRSPPIAAALLDAAAKRGRAGLRRTSTGLPEWPARQSKRSSAITVGPRLPGGL